MSCPDSPRLLVTVFSRIAVPLLSLSAGTHSPLLTSPASTASPPLDTPPTRSGDCETFFCYWTSESVFQTARRKFMNVNGGQLERLLQLNSVLKWNFKTVSRASRPTFWIDIISRKFLRKEFQHEAFYWWWEVGVFISYLFQIIMEETEDFDGCKMAKLELFVRNCNIKLSGQCAVMTDRPTVV